MSIFGRKMVLEASELNSFRPNKKDKPKWRVIETAVRGNVAVEVSELPLRIPRYSFRVGNAQFDPQGSSVTVGPRVTIFNFNEAAELLAEIGNKYEKIREEKIEEIEQLKAQYAHHIVDPTQNH